MVADRTFVPTNDDRADDESGVEASVCTSWPIRCGSLRRLRLATVGCAQRRVRFAIGPPCSVTAKQCTAGMPREPESTVTAGVAVLLTEPTTPYTKSNRPFRQFIACEVVPTAAASIRLHQRRFGPCYRIACRSGRRSVIRCVRPWRAARRRRSNRAWIGAAVAHV